MIELKNSRTTYLGRASGGDKYSLDAFIGAVQMREPGGQWQDIQPRLIREAGGWHVEGAPYHAEIKDDGTRLFCPDRNERSRYLRLPAPALFSGIDKNLMTNPGKLDGIHRPNQITMPADWGEYRIIFSNTGMHFEVLFTKAPPANVFGKDSPRILLDVETAGYDIGQLLKATSGTGIPKPRLMAADPEMTAGDPQRWLDWSYQNGQLELGFDFGELSFPILLKNTTVDVQVGAGADDVTVYTGTNEFQDDSTKLRFGYKAYSDSGYMGSAGRFTTVAVPQGATIDTAYISLREKTGLSGTTLNCYIDAEDADNATQITSQSDWESRARTTTRVAWDDIPGWSVDTWYNSPDIKAVIQEVVNRGSWSSGNAMNIFWSDYEDQRSDYNAWREPYSYDGGSASAPKLHIEYTAGGGTEKTSAETGSGAEVSSLLAAMTKAESGGGADTKGSFLASLAKAESGSGIDQSTLSLRLSSSDTGTGVDAASGLLAGLTKNDSGSGVEALSALGAALLAAESSIGIEASTLPSIIVKFDADAGAGAEAAGLMAGLATGEDGSGADALTVLLAVLLAAETGSGIDQSTLTSIVARLSAETGSGEDIAELIAEVISSETGLGVDIGMIVGLKQLFSGDEGTSGDALKALISTSGSGSDMKLPGRQGRVGIPSRGVSL